MPEPETVEQLIRKGRKSQQAGDRATAESHYRKATVLDPDSGNACLHLASVLTDLGQIVESLDHYEKALELNPDSPPVHSGLGYTLLTAGRLEEAEKHCRRAIELDPKYWRALHNLGAIHSARGEYAEAVDTFLRATSIAPDSVPVRVALGDSCLNIGDHKKASESYREALKSDPYFAPSWRGMGETEVMAGHFNKAEQCYRKALDLQPEYAPGWLSLGRLAQLSGSRELAVSHFEKAVKLNPNYAPAYGSLSNALLDLGKVDEALETARKGLTFVPSDLQCLTAVGIALDELNQHVNSLAVFEEAIELHPRSSELFVHRGLLQDKLGFENDAAESFRKAIDLDPKPAKAYGLLAGDHTSEITDLDLEAMEELVTDTLLPKRSLSTLAFGIAKALHRRKEYEQASVHLRSANRLRTEDWTAAGEVYPAEAHSRIIDELIAVFDQSYFDRTQSWGNQSDVPVYVFGLPRSGTTLTEQILASHPDVHGAGELKYTQESLWKLRGSGYPGPRGWIPISASHPPLEEEVAESAREVLGRLRELSPDALRVIDKMPENYLSLGWAATIFPQAKLIHCRRDFRDVALSCWRTNFRAIRWASDPKLLIARLRDYCRLMNHWRKVLPFTMLEIDYEETVSDLEGNAKRLIDWIGLDWDPACLDFYETERAVRTASKAQVRQPIHSRSVGAWKNYEKDLGGLFAEVNRIQKQTPEQLHGRRKSSGGSRKKVAPAETPKPVKDADLFVAHLQRSGISGFTDWLLAHYRGTKTFHRELSLDSQCGTEPFPRQTLLFPCEDPDAEPVSIASTEDCPLPSVQSLIDRMECDKFLLLLRDPFNLFASILQANRLSRDSSADDNTANINIDTDIWKAYAREFCSPKIFPDAIRVNFNQWYQCQEYRVTLAETLGLEFTDHGFGKRRGWKESRGAASSSEALDLTNRWRLFEKDDEYRSLFDEEINDLSRRLFDFDPL